MMLENFFSHPAPGFWPQAIRLPAEGVGTPSSVSRRAMADTVCPPRNQA